jgi:hypothetical protein
MATASHTCRAGADAQHRPTQLCHRGAPDVRRITGRRLSWARWFRRARCAWGSHVVTHGGGERGAAVPPWGPCACCARLLESGTPGVPPGCWAARARVSGTGDTPLSDSGDSGRSRYGLENPRHIRTGAATDVGELCRCDAKHGVAGPTGRVHVAGALERGIEEHRVWSVVMVHGRDTL